MAPANSLGSSAGSAFGTVEQVFDDTWCAWGTVRYLPGVLFPRNMTIIRERGALVVVHPILMPEQEQKRIDALGPIRHIVRLGASHGLDDAAYVRRYNPTVWAPPGVDQPVRPDRELVPGGELPLAGASLFTFDSSRAPETAIHLTRHDGVLLTSESVQNWETKDGCSMLGKVMARAMGLKGRARIGPGWRKHSEPKDGTGFWREFASLLALDFRHVLPGHGAPIKDTAREDLRAEVKRIYKI